MIYADQYLSPKVFDVSTVTKLVRNTAMLVVIPYLSFKHTNYKETDISLGKKLTKFSFFYTWFLFLGLVRTFGDYSLEQNSKAFGLFNIELWNGLIFEINFFQNYY